MPNVDADARTRGIARVLGPFLVLTAAAAAARAPGLGATIASFAGDAALIWLAGALTLVSGLAIIAFHQIWSNAAAVVVSLLGWLLALRGAALMFAPQLFLRMAESAARSPALMIAGFAVFGLIGAWLAYVGWLAGSGRLGA